MSNLRVCVTIHRIGKWFVAVDTVTWVASQGKTCDEALKNGKNQEPMHSFFKF